MNDLRSGMTIYHVTIMFRSGSWVRLSAHGREHWIGPQPASYDEAVALSMSGAFDRPDSSCHPRQVCVAVESHDRDEYRIVYTGLIRRVLEGGDEMMLVDHVRATKDTGDVSWRHNISDGLPARAAAAVELVLARSWSGVDHRIHGEHGDLAALDRMAQRKFDDRWAEYAAQI